MEVVQILMSTYNGEKYLREQLNSILEQTYPSIELLIRDDGSTDGTVEILKEYSETYENVRFYQGSNKGAIQSFLELLRESNDNAKYYAFADQDDVWLPEKIEKAVKSLEKKQSDQPLLYCSDLYITDENLNVIKVDDKRHRPSFGNALVQNICTGCTAVMNRALRDIINQSRPENIVMHDWWFYLAATLFGKVIYDQTPYMYYRQHGHNEWGAKKNKMEVLKYRLQQLTKKRGYIFQQNEEVLKAFPQIDIEKRRLLEMVQQSEQGIVEKIRLACNRKIYRNGKEDDMVYRMIVIMGKL